jgi:hypothetical protein
MASPRRTNEQEYLQVCCRIHGSLYIPVREHKLASANLECVYTFVVKLLVAITRFQTIANTLFFLTSSFDSVFSYVRQSIKLVNC